MIEWREANEQGEHFIQGKGYDQPEKLELSPPEKKKKMKNVEQNKNSPVEIIEGRLKRLHTNEIDARIETQTPGQKGVGVREKQRQLGRKNQRIT